MSIRNLARELYRLQKEVEDLERDLGSGPPERRKHIEERLRQTRAERDRMRKILEGRKEKPPYRRPL
ncbi:MAG: hypothetical protein JRH06_12810 [Deltaproteobacteria bacterium]|nr:hypothetical protein [Deltaproteobacteria bacterium]MBW2138422.1 hypothetical protein [Deltaproteobacteria bacterium]